MNTWPLPSPSRDGFEFTDDHGLRLGGLPLSINRDYVHAPRRYQLNFNFTQAQMGELYEFVETNQCGWFLMSLPSATGYSEQTVRIITDITESQIGPDVYRAGFSVERLTVTADGLDFEDIDGITYDDLVLEYDATGYQYGGEVPEDPLALEISTVLLDELYDCVGDTGVCPNPTNVTSDAVTVTATGGNGIYSFSWAWVSGEVLTPTAPTSATTAFVGSLSHNEATTSVYRCTVVSNAQTEDIDVTIDLEYTYTASSLSLSVAPDPCEGLYDCTGSYGFCGTPEYVTSAPATVTVGGGSGAITYAVSHVSGDVFTINSPTAATTTFSASLAHNEAKTGVYRWTVTRGGITNTVDFTVNLEYTFTLDLGPGGGGLEP